MEEVTTIFEDGKKVENIPLDAEYTMTGKWVSSLNKNVFVCTIMYNDVIKLSLVKYVIESQKIIIDSFFENKKELNVDNCVLYTIMEFKKGVRFVPDINMQNTAKKL